MIADWEIPAPLAWRPGVNLHHHPKHFSSNCLPKSANNSTLSQGACDSILFLNESIEWWGAFFESLKSEDIYKEIQILRNYKVVLS